MKNNKLSYYSLNALLLFSFISNVVFFILLQIKYFGDIGFMILSTICFIIVNLLLIAVIQYNEDEK